MIGACEFTIPGPPAVKGSTWSFIDRAGYLRTKTDCKHGDAWAQDVAWRAKSAGVSLIPKGTGVIVFVVYEFAPPARRIREAPCVRPDVDKLARALLDALTGVAYEDDGQVVTLTVRKRYGPDTLTRVFIDQA